MLWVKIQGVGIFFLRFLLFCKMLSLPVGGFWKSQEILGYNVKLSYDELGSGAVAGYYAVTGCKDFNNVTHRGCMQGVTQHKIMKLHMLKNTGAPFAQQATFFFPQPLGSRIHHKSKSVLDDFVFTTRGLTFPHFNTGCASSKKKDVIPWVRLDWENMQDVPTFIKTYGP